MAKPPGTDTLNAASKQLVYKKGISYKIAQRNEKKKTANVLMTAARTRSFARPNTTEFAPSICFSHPALCFVVNVIAIALVCP